MNLMMSDPVEDTMQSAGPSVTLTEVGQAILRRKRLVLISTLIGAVLAYGLSMTMQPKYTAEVSLISDASLSGIVEQRLGDPYPQADPSATQTIVETIGSNIVIRRAIASLPPHILDVLRQDAKIESEVDEKLPKSDNNDAERQELETALLGRYMARELEINNSGRSYTIYIRYRTADPVVAAAVANAVSSAYLGYRAELKRGGYGNSLLNLERELTALKTELQQAELTAQAMREQMRLLGVRSEALTGRLQEEAIAQSAELFSRQREAEREAEAAASVYERLLLNQREIQSRIDAPEMHVYLFAPAVVPTRPSGFNAKPIILMMGLVTGFLVGTSIALFRRPSSRRKAPHAARG